MHILVRFTEVKTVVVEVPTQPVSEAKEQAEQFVKCRHPNSILTGLLTDPVDCDSVESVKSGCSYSYELSDWDCLERNESKDCWQLIWNGSENKED